ncbi:MAG: response regulator [Methylobacter sp.]|nr:response regulator [Methylobacter sp.]
MKLLIASSLDEIKAEIQSQLAAVDIKGDQLTFVNTVDNFVKKLKTDAYNLIIADYAIEGADIWQLAKLINSSPLSAHALPLFLVEEACELEIPTQLAREHSFKVVSLNELGTTLTSAYHDNLSIGYERGRINPDKHTLLIIEDDEDAAHSAFHAIKDSYTIDIVRDGLSGYKLWESKRHDLVLLDLMLPIMNGDVVLSKIMAVDELQPVIIITGHDRAYNSKELLLNGASEYLCKPFSMSTLKTQCQTLLMRAKLIYQAHYTSTKLKTLTNLMWALDQALAQKNIDKAQRVMTAIKTLLPGKPSEDEQLNLTGLEF